MTRNSDTRYDHESYRGGAETQTAKPGTGERNSSFKRGKCVLSRNKRFFRSEPLEVSKNLRMRFIAIIAIKTDGDTLQGKDGILLSHRLRKLNRPAPEAGQPAEVSECRPGNRPAPDYEAENRLLPDRPKLCAGYHVGGCSVQRPSKAIRFPLFDVWE